MFIKPTLSRAGALSNESDQYAELVDQLVFLVRDARLMSYAEVGFRDDGEANRHAGINAHVVLFAEKVGQAAFLKEMADRYQISTVALGGQPSVLTIEYFVRDLKQRGVDLRRSFYLFSIVDYDTSGWIIRDSFVKNLKAFGIQNIKVVDLVNPDALSPAEIDASRFRIPEDRSSAPKNTEWLRKARDAGYNNQPLLDPDPNEKRRAIYGIESEAISSKRFAEKLADLAPPLLGKSERLFRIAHLENLTKALDTLALVTLKRDRTERR